MSFHPTGPTDAIRDKKDMLAAAAAALGEMRTAI
jgi:hypothetical protein